MAISVKWGSCALSTETADTGIIMVYGAGPRLSGKIYKAPGSKDRTKDYVVAALKINGQTFISPGINVKGTWHSSTNSKSYIYNFEVTGCTYNTTYFAEVTFYWSDTATVTSVAGLPTVVSNKYTTSVKTPHATGTISASGSISMDSSNYRPSMFKISCSTNPAADSAITYKFSDGDVFGTAPGPTISDLKVSSSSNYTRYVYSSSIDSTNYYGKTLSYVVKATYDSDGQSFTGASSIGLGDNNPRVQAKVPYPKGSTGIGLSYRKEEDKVFVYAYTSSELYDRPGTIVWNDETLFDDTITKGSEIKKTVELIKKYYSAPSTDGTYSGKITVTNPDDSVYGEMTNVVAITSNLEADDGTANSTFKINISGETAKVTFETGRKLTSSKNITISLNYIKNNGSKEVVKTDDMTLPSGSYKFEHSFDLSNAPNGNYEVVIQNKDLSTDKISKTFTLLRKIDETNLKCSIAETARNAHRFYCELTDFVPDVKYTRTVEITLKKNGTTFLENQVLNDNIPDTNETKTSISGYISWDKASNVYDATITAIINVYGNINGTKTLLKSFGATSSDAISVYYPAWSPIQEFSWPEGQEVAVGKKFNITAETWNNLQLKVISSIENIIDDLDSSSIIDVQSGQIFTKDIYNNLISFLNLAEVKSYISATTDLPTAESITKYLNENHLFVYNTPMDLPIYDISKYGKPLPQTVVITAKKLNDIVDRVNAIIRKLNSTSTTS